MSTRIRRRARIAGTWGLPASSGTASRMSTIPCGALQGAYALRPSLPAPQLKCDNKVSALRCHKRVKFFLRNWREGGIFQIRLILLVARAPITQRSRCEPKFQSVIAICLWCAGNANRLLGIRTTERTLLVRYAIRPASSTTATATSWYSTCRRRHAEGLGLQAHFQSLCREV